MATIFNFLTAHWFTIAYPFVGYTLGKITGKMYLDNTPNEELGSYKKSARLIFFPSRFYYWTKRSEKIIWNGPEIRSTILDKRKNDYDGLYRCLDIYIKVSILVWPLSLIHYAVGLSQLFMFSLFKFIFIFTSLPEKSYSLLQDNLRKIKKLTPGKNLDIKTSINLIEKFLNSDTRLKQGQILAQITSLEGRSREINVNLENWQIVIRKNPDTSANINLVIYSLDKEVKKLNAQKLALQETMEKQREKEKNLSECKEILYRCLSTIPLNIPVPVTAEGPELIRGDYLAKLAADTISRAEAEMSRLQNE